MRIILQVSCATTLLYAGTYAAAGETRDLSTLPLEDLVQLQVVTAASRFEQLVSEAPSPVVVLSAADIRDFGWRTLADALATVPGLYVANDRGYSYLGARGVLRPGDYNSRFLLMIDGVRTNDAVYDQALIGTEALFDLDMVKRIEYVPGPGSAVYGSNALFGVINVVTRDGNGLPGVRAALAAGSFGERKALASYGMHHQDGADLLLSASSYQRTGQDLYFPEFDTPDQNHGVAHRLDYDRAQHLFAKGSYGGFTFEGAYAARTKGIPTATYGAVFNMPFRIRDTNANVALSWNGRVLPAVDVAAQLLWGRADYLASGYYPQDAGPVLNVDGDQARWYGINVNATISALPGHKIVVGMETGVDARRAQFNYDQDPYALLLDDRAPAAKRTAIFVEDEIRLPAGLLLNAGLRYDRRPSSNASRFSPRAALLYKATPRDTVKLIAGSAFRTANAYEMFYAYPGEFGQLANPNLRPERVTTHELAYDHQLSGSGHATVSLFHNSVADLINEQVDAATGRLVFRNLDHVEARGVETAIERQFGGAHVRASYTWQLARGNGGAPLIDSPRHLANANLALPLPWRNARLGSELVCSSARLGERETAGGYCVANLTLTLPRLAPGADLSVSVYNAFDKRYADIADVAFRRETIARQSRTLYAKLGYRF